MGSDLLGVLVQRSHVSICLVGVRYVQDIYVTQH